MYHILVLEDDYWIRSGMIEMLERIGGQFKVAGEATDGEEGWNLVQELCPTIVITDISMPKMDGLSLIRRIHDEQYPIVSIIVSGFDHFAYAQQAIHYGVTEYLLKPVMQESLEEALVKSIHRLELLQPVHKQLLKIQQLIDQIPAMEPQAIMLEQARLVKWVLKSRQSAPRSGIGLLRIFAARLESLIVLYAADSRVAWPEKETEDSLAAHIQSLCELWCSLVLSKPDQRSTRLIMKQSCDFVEKSYMHEISLAQMAEHAGLSVSHFSALFKQHAGDSFVNYLNRYRIGEAKQLLLDPELKIYQIADMVGFSSIPYFNRVFKNMTEQTPNEYRKGFGV